MKTDEIIGYRVRSTLDGMHVHYEHGRHYLHRREPEPISRPDAYRRLAGFLDDQDGSDEQFEVVPVYREYTPLESAASELGSLLSSLCNRHGLDLGMSKEQIEKQLAKELLELSSKK